MTRKMFVRSVLPTLSLSLLLAACGGGDTSDGTTHVTTLSDSGAGSLRQAIADATAGDTLKLTAAGTLSLASPITTDKNLTIIADGVTVDAGGKGRVLEVPAGVTLTIKGGTLTGGLGQIVPLSVQATRFEQGQGKLSAQATAVPTYGGVIMNKGNLTLEGTTVSAGTANFGGGVWNAEKATLTLGAGSKLTGNAANKSDYDGARGGGVYNEGTLNISGGAVDSNTAYYSGGGIQNYGTLNISGGSVSNNACTFPFSGTTEAEATGCGGGGIRTSGPTTISGGNIDNNTATYYGGGLVAQVLCKDSACKPEEYLYFPLTISGGTVSGNKATGTVDVGGGGLWLRANTSITGGTISGNSAMYGGGIQNWHALDITGGVIENNTASQNGGGINIFGTQTLPATVHIGGTAKIQNNTAAATSGGVGIYGYTDAMMDGGTISGNKVTNPDGYGAGVRVGGTAKLTLSSGEISRNTTLFRGGGLAVAGALNMTGGTVAANTSTGTDRSKGQGNAAGIWIDAAGKVTISSGSVTGNTAALRGGGITVGGSYVDSTGKTVPTGQLTLSGGKIDNNFVTAGYGGGVVVDGSMNLTSGSINGNTAGGTNNNDGVGTSGGVRVNPKGEFTASGGTISNNKATSHGGGVYIGGSYVDNGTTVPGGKFTMSEVTISANTSGTIGGGVVNGGTFLLQGGNITSNTSVQAGGGVRNWSGSTFTQTGGRVSGNNPDEIKTDQ